MKKLITIVSVFVISCTANAQQWSGNNNVSDPINRTGSVGIGTTGYSSEKLTVLGGIRAKTSNNLPPVQGYGSPSVQNLQNSIVLGKVGNPHEDISNFYITRFEEGLQISPSHFVSQSGPMGLEIISVTASPSLFISNNTQVGIGTYNVDCSNCSDYRLFVKDGIKTEKVKVEIAANNGWADYVFKKDYKLMPLQEVEQFINEKGHLPEVPSEAEAIANGIELKEMNILLLKKIEELTLYSIEQQKQIEQQNKRILALENEMKSSK